MIFASFENFKNKENIGVINNKNYRESKWKVEVDRAINLKISFLRLKTLF